MSFVKLSSMGLGLGLSVLLGGVITPPEHDAATPLSAHQGNAAVTTADITKNSGMYDAQDTCALSESYTEVATAVDNHPMIENSATDEILYEDFDDNSNIDSYQQRTILEILSLGLDEQQIGTLNETNEYKAYNDYHQDENLSSLIVNRVSELEKDSVTRDYLVSLLRAYPSGKQKIAIKRLIATGSEKDQLSAVDLITNIEDTDIKISAVELALSTNLATPAHQALLDEIGKDPYISNHDSIRNTLINRLYRTNTSEAAFNLISAIPPKDDISTRVYQEVVQKLDSGNEEMSLKAIQLSGQWIRSGSMRLSESQKKSLVKKLEHISSDRLKPTQNRMESLNILEHLI